MSQPREVIFNPSSPRSSSGGAESFKGTPDTRFTAFSLDDTTSGSTMRKGLKITAGDAPSTKLPVNNFIDKDPFVSPHASIVSRLSPTASAFNPFGNAALPPQPVRNSVMPTLLSTDLGLSRRLRVSASTPPSTAEICAFLADLETNGTERYGRDLVSGHDGQLILQFTDIRDACSIRSAIHAADNGWSVDFVNPIQLLKESSVSREEITTQTGQVAIFAAPIHGAVIDSTWAMETVRSFLQRHGQLFALARRSTYPDGSFRAVAEFCDTSVVTHFLRVCGTSITIEGMHMIVSPGEQDTVRPFDLAHAMQGMTLSKDPAQAYRQQQGKQIAMQPVSSLDMRVQSHIPMYPFLLQSPLGSTIPYTFDPFNGTPANHPGCLASVAPVSPHYSIMSTLYQTPPSPPLTATNPYSPSKALTGIGRPDIRRQNAARINRSPYHNSVGHHNHVDTSRIREGTDVRTTIMLRNIPNKVDQAMLKRIVDDSSWGKYDFMYLRIDFANDCNVGYAFINFVDPLDIIDFVEARGNQRWNCFKSDKVAEISYATIQGKDCLVQKFRNSSVMLEAPHYRPKARLPAPKQWRLTNMNQLFFTSNGPLPELAGQEEPFPEPDNQSKMKRSCENAEHVGLFTPNAGQHFRDEQRRRRSQYDRGTRLAALEEYDYETAIQHLYKGAT